MSKPRPNGATETALTPAETVQACHRSIVRLAIHPGWHRLLAETPEPARDELVKLFDRLTQQAAFASRNRRADDALRCINHPPAFGRVLQSLAKLGGDASADGVLRHAHVNRKAGRDILRVLAALGCYTGYAKPRPAAWPADPQ